MNEFNTSLLTKDNLVLSSSRFCDGDEIMIQGKRSKMTLRKNIPIEGKGEIFASTKVKNTGSQPTKIYVGYAVFNKDGIALNGKNYPYSLTNPILTVISADEGSNTIIVDKYPSWGKNCYIALDPKEDFSDIPSVNLLTSRIVNATEESNGQAIITLDSPLKTSLEKGTQIRIHGQSGTYLYTDIKELNPGDELEFSSVMKKDDSVLQHSPKAFSRGISFINPIVLSYSKNPEEDNTILVSDLQIYSTSK